VKLIDRYLDAVKRYLPEEIAEDVGMELRANIEDMLPENYTEDDVYQVLMKLGSPRKLANEYNPQKKYLIGPGYYDKYVSVLKKVIGICVFVSLVIAFLGWMIESSADWYEANNLANLVGSIISSSITGALQGAFWVTLVFVLLERSGVEAGYIPAFHKEWTPNDLPELTTNHKKKISRGEILVSMFFTILFTAVIYLQPQLIALYSLGGKDNVKVTALFNIERLDLYMPFILMLVVIKLGIFVWKYITESWNKPLSIVNAVYNISICVLILVMLCDKLLINEAIISALADLRKVSVLTLSNWLGKAKWIFGLVFIGSCLFDSIMPFIKGRSKS